MNSNDPANDVYEYETEILRTREDLFWELQTTGDVKIDGVVYELHEFIEMISDEEKDNIVEKAFRRSATRLKEQPHNANFYTVELIWEIFCNEISDEVIFEHYVDEKSEY